jgi:anti-anti-sigma factor
MPVPPAILIPFEASLSPQTAGSRISVSGEVDLTTAPHLRGLLTEATRSASGPVEVDLSGVSFCDVSGVNALVVARAALIALGRQLVLLNVPARIARVLVLAAGQLLFEPA